MSVILIFFLSCQSIFGLQSKLFGKNLIDPTSISSEEIKKSSITMDKITCSTLCLKESYNCEAFYFKDNACMIIKDTAGMTQATNTQEALTVFINENPKEIEVGTLFQGHILVHPEQWTPYIYKSEPSTNYEKCGILCELTNQADFFALHSGICYCGNLGHYSGSTIDLGQNLIQIHIKFEAVDSLMDENWVRLEEGDQWHQWIYEVHQQDENTGHRECLFRGMYHQECDYVKFYYGLKKCFLGSFSYTGESKVLDTTNMDALVYLKKNGQGEGEKGPDFEKTDFIPEFSTLESEFTTYGPIFRFHIKLTVNALPEGDHSNIFCLRNEEGKFQARYPALYISKLGRFRFVFNSLGGFDSAEGGIELQNPFEIIIEQSFKETKLIFEISVNQEIVASVENTQPEMFTDAQLYIADKYFETADVSIEYFKLYLGQPSNQDQFIKNNYISMVGDTTKSNGIMSSQFWPTSLYKSLNIKESELTCAEMCSLVANCQFYYFVELMPSQDNVCHFGDFAYADYTKQYNEITDDTEYKLNANLDLESFGPEANPACPGSGRTKLETMLTLEYDGNTVAACFYSLYAPNAKELKIKIEQLTIHDGDSMNLVVAPAFGGHRIAALSSTSSGGEYRVQSRFLKVFWKNVDTNVEAKWKMTITPLY